MITDDTNSNTSTSIESACLPIGCAVSAKYRGAFCSGNNRIFLSSNFYYFFSHEKHKSKQSIDKSN